MVLGKVDKPIIFLTPAEYECDLINQTYTFV